MVVDDALLPMEFKLVVVELVAVDGSFIRKDG